MREMVRKMKHIRVIAAIVMCMVAVSVEASEVTVFEEYFSAFSTVGYSATACNGWTLNRCSNVATSENVLMVVGTSAITPSIGRLDGDGRLSFKYSSATTKSASFKVKIVGGGKFYYNNKEVTEISLTSSDKDKGITMMTERNKVERIR